MLYFFGYILSWDLIGQTTLTFSEDIGGNSSMLITTKNPEIREKILALQDDIKQSKAFIIYGEPYITKIDGSWIKALKLMNIDKVREENNEA